MNRIIKRMLSQNSSLMNDSNEIASNPPNRLPQEQKQDQLFLTTKQIMEMDIESLPPFEINSKQKWNMISEEILNGLYAQDKPDQSRRYITETPKMKKNQCFNRNRVRKSVQKIKQQSVEWSMNLLPREKYTKVISLALMPNRIRRSYRSQTMLNNPQYLQELEAKFTLFRRKTCQGEQFGMETRKEKHHINLQCEIGMLRKQRMADIIIKNLKNTQRKTIINYENKRMSVLKKVLEEQNMLALQSRNLQIPLIEQPACQTTTILECESPINNPMKRLTKIQSQRNFGEIDSPMSNVESEKIRNQQSNLKKTQNQLKKLMTTQISPQSIHFTLLKKSKQLQIPKQIFANKHFILQDKLSLQIDTKKFKHLKSLNSVTASSKQAIGRENEILSVYTNSVKKYQSIHLKPLSLHKSKQQL